MDVTVVVGLVKGVSTPRPRFETELTGLEVLDAYQLVSQAGRAAPGNVCDPNYTMHAAVDKAFLAGVPAYGDVHRRLRATAGESR